MSENKSLRRPVIDPLLLALKSRRVLVATVALLVGILTLAVPELQPVRSELLTLLITLALAVIGGYSIEDAANAGRQRATLPAEELRELIKDVLNEVIDEVANGSPTEPGDETQSRPKEKRYERTRFPRLQEAETKPER